MEAFEHVEKVFPESRGFAVSTNVKFLVRRRTKKQACEEFGVDLVAARADELLLGSSIGRTFPARTFGRDVLRAQGEGAGELGEYRTRRLVLETLDR